MKINFRMMAAAAMTAMLALGACSKEDVGSTDNGETAVFSLKLSQASESTRAVADAATENVVSFNTGYVIFSNNAGGIVKVTEIIAGTPTADQITAGSHVSITALKTATTGAKIENVPSSSKNVHIIGNLPSGVPVPAIGNNINTYKATALTIQSQSNAAGSTADVMLFGESDIKTAASHATLTDGDLYATVSVDAIAARIEIGSIAYDNGADPDFITAFNIDGIFVNYYYPSMSLDSKVTTALVNNAPADNATADKWYNPADAASKYPTATPAALYDYKTAASLGVALTSPETGWKADATTKVWAYNVLAPTSFGSPVTALAAPHIVIRLSSIVATTPSVYTTTQYLTVKEFKNTETGTVIDKFEPGMIYYITKLTFNESNLTDVPEQGTVSVFVEAKLMEWERVAVEGGF